MKTLASVLAAGFLLAAHDAQALAVTNLDKVAHTLHIGVLGDEQAVVIAPNQTYRTWGYGYTLRLDDDTREIRSAQNNDFAIWSPGRLAIQTYRAQRCSTAYFR